MLDTNIKYNSGKKVVEQYNEISFSLNTDLVFQKIDNLTPIKYVYNENSDIKYITKLGVVIKHEKWDDIVTIMDQDNLKAYKVYLVSDFLNINNLNN